MVDRTCTLLVGVGTVVVVSGIAVLVKSRKSKSHTTQGHSIRVDKSGRVQNWFGNHTWTPVRIVEPSSLSDLVQAVVQARDNRGPNGEACPLRVRASGALHSWSDSAEIDGGVMVRMENLNRVLSVDVKLQRVTVEAGIRLEKLYAHLKRHGLALPAVPNTDKLLLGGVVANASHGTSLSCGTVSSRVVAMDLLTADGVVRTLRAEAPEGTAEHEQFDCALVSAGCVGIVYSFTLQCVPAYNCIVHERVVPAEHVAENVQALLEAHDSLFLMQHPDKSICLSKLQSKISPVISKAGSRNVFEDYLIECWMYYQKPGQHKFWKWLFGCCIDRAAHMSPALLFALNSAVKVLEWDDAEITVKSWKDRAFLNCEYAVPISRINEACALIQQRVVEFREAGQYLRASGWVLRPVAPDSRGYLSPARGSQAVVYVDIPYQSMDPAELHFFRKVELDLIALGGRVSWARRFNCSGEEVLANYPDAAKFTKVVQELDPHSMFSNAFRRRVFGF